MKSLQSLLRLWFITAEDLAVECCTSAERDFKTVTCRSNKEGTSFLTITLPSLSGALEKGLATGTYNPSDASAFACIKGGSLPAFLQGFFCQVFDQTTGILLDVPSIPAIRAIRQLTGMFKKLELPCSPERVAKAYSRYVKCDLEIHSWETEASPSLLDDFSRAFRYLWGDVFNSVNDKLERGFLHPKHGPGATATKIIGNQKYEQLTWTDRLESVMPYLDYALPSYRYHNRLREIVFLAPEQEPPVRVVDVPKTLKTPRIIAIEPVWQMYCQQALLNGLLSGLQNHALLRKVANFKDQEPNQLSAFEGSKSGRTATLDLSEASDRVSNLLVRTATKYWPSVSRALQATRSERADVPGHGEITLAKFASMGSAMCFFMEEVVFSTIIFMAIAKVKNTSVSQALRRYSDTVRVYGDDLVVPVDCAIAVVDLLETYGLRVNHTKSFWTGKFRESCGKEYYDGEDVTIFRVGQLLPESRQDVKLVESAVSLRNHAYKRGFWSTAAYLDDFLVGILRYFPAVGETTDILGRHTFLEPEGDRLSSLTHTPLVRGWVPRRKTPPSQLADEWALLKFFLNKAESSSEHEDELEVKIDPLVLDLLSADSFERAGRPKSATLSLRWRPVS